MAEISQVQITGEDLTPEQLHAIALNKDVKVVVSSACRKKIKKSQDFLMSKATNTPIYGVTTGFGPMASHIIGKSQVTELQYNLVRSHACGNGEPIAKKYALAAMVVRLNTLVKGHSGVSLELIDTLVELINKRVIAYIPEHGAVGTSGDLVQLAHIAELVIGEGRAYYKGELLPTTEIFKKAKITPHKLNPKEGLSLINGTSVMAAIAALLTIDAEKLISLEIQSSAMALELIHGISDSVNQDLHDLRPHKGQCEVASLMRQMLKDSKLLDSRKNIEKRVGVSDKVCVTDTEIQNVYSFRCVPQIIGPILDTYRKAKADVNTEINSVTDNPVIYADKKLFLHGGNFHGDYIATAVDQLKAGIVKLSMLSERRTNFFLNQNVNKSFPPFLNLNQPGLTLALQGLQFVATSTVAVNQSLGYPHTLHSIPTNADNQDVVSMGTDASLIADKVLDNTFLVQAIELATLAQVVDFLNVEGDLAPAAAKLYEDIRSVFAVVKDDRSLTNEISTLADCLRARVSFDL